VTAQRFVPWGVVVVAALLAADAATACPSCVDPRDATQSAMVVGTIALSLLPLGFIGGVAAWLWRAHRAGEDAAVGERRDHP
jgi:hypothetical protein